MENSSQKLTSNLTVKKLQEICENLSKNGLGENEIVIPLDSIYPSIGKRQTISIKNVNPGFDWDSGYVFLEPEESLQKNDVDVKNEFHHLHNTLGHVLYMLSSLEKQKENDEKQKIIDQIENYLHNNLKKVVNRKKNKF